MSTITKFQLFTMPNCDKCHKAGEFLKNLQIKGTVHDLSSGDGLAEFRSKYKNLKEKLKRNEDGSLPVPTVLLYDENESVVGTCHTVEELKLYFN